MVSTAVILPLRRKISRKDDREWTRIGIANGRENKEDNREWTRGEPWSAASLARPTAVGAVGRTFRQSPD
jgi:hypothetical protein